VTAGVGPPALESCEGDEYVITVKFLDEESTVEEAPVEIVLTKLNKDGSTEELRLEGDLLDAQALTLQLTSEGNCVRLETGTATEGGTPSVGTSQAVVPTEGVPPSAADRDPGEPAAPDSP
jgi:hypothetical protein